MATPCAHLAAPNDAAWARLSPGATLTIVKLAPDGSEAAQYGGRVLTPFSVEGWLVVAAEWTYRPMALDGLEFRPGDCLREWFSPRFMFNAFAVHSPDGDLRGWYGNVTYPARLDGTTTPPTLFWRDLYLDLVGLPDGTFVQRDEDELVASGLAEHDPLLVETIQQAASELVRRFSAGLPPFARDPPPIPAGRAENRRQT